MKLHRQLPNLVRHFCWNCDAWIVGSSVEILLGIKPEQTQTPDLDIVVNPKYWNEVAGLCTAHNPRLNSFGGIKVTIDGITVDVWPDDVAYLMGNHHVAIALHPKTRTVLRREKLDKVSG